jgi:glycosyltransferase involved in cell wall biosynthesis
VGPSLDILGGQAIQAQRLLQALSASSQLQVAFLAVNPRLPGPLRCLQRVKYLRTIITSVAYGVSLLMRVPRTDVVHAFSASYASYLLAPMPALLVARLFRRGSILNYRSGEAADHLQNWPLSRWSIAHLPSRIVVPSGYLVQVFAKFGIRAQSIANFVPLDTLPYRRRATFRPVFLSNRNLEPLYNVECTLRAFRHIQDQYPDAQLLVAGDGAERGPLERLCQALRLTGVGFLGKVNATTMAGLYDRCDFYLNSPNIDNMPSSILEAFACGLPVITTDAGGIPFIVRHGQNGMLVPANDSEALAGAALQLLGNQSLAMRLADAARAECEQQYVWVRVRAEWEQCYREVAAT